MGWLFAKLYDRMTRASEDAGLRDWRAALLQQARGDVLELGAGTGLNLPLYPAEVRRLFVTEPDRHMRTRLAARAQSLGMANVEVADAGAERLPVADASIDTVVCTLVLCTVPAPERSLREIIRVLRPGGALLFVEHVAWDDPRRFRWQRRIEPFWKWFACGCHLTRRTGEMMRDAGFELETVVEGDMPRAPVWVRPTIRGLARKPG